MATQQLCELPPLGTRQRIQRMFQDVSGADAPAKVIAAKKVLVILACAWVQRMWGCKLRGVSLAGTDCVLDGSLDVVIFIKGTIKSLSFC